jgi:adenine-specific DNA-methyltransferase
MMRDRLLQVRLLLAPEGSVWVHCDDYEQHRLRLVMDEVFGLDRFVATIVWQKRYSRDNRPGIGAVHDFIHIYAPMGGDWKHHRNRLVREAAKEYRNPNHDPRGPWRVLPMTAQGYRANQMYEIVTPAGVPHRPPKGRCWSMIRATYDGLLAQGRIYFGQDDRGQPGVIRYLDEDEGLVPWTWWTHQEVGHSDEAKKEILTLFPNVEAFATPKPERLMRRILEIATDPEDIVLDFFAGSATTVAVAHKMGRRWIAVESSAETVATFALPRLTRVVEGLDPGGVTEAFGWEGGGGFQVLDIAPSMYVSVNGLVFLADWATNGALAETTAAQLGFAYEPDGRPFCGRKGRRRLAVVDGLVDGNVVRLLVGELGDREQVVIAGTSIDPAARKELPKGSTLRKIPDALLQTYQRESRLADLVPPDLPPSPAGAAT